MRAKKNGEYLNCYVDKDTNQQFALLADLLGKTKTKLLEEAMSQYLAPYLTTTVNGMKLDAKPAWYIMSSFPSGSFEGVQVEARRERCWLLGRMNLAGMDYCKIIKGGSLLNVPADFIVCDTEE